MAPRAIHLHFLHPDANAIELPTIRSMLRKRLSPLESSVAIALIALIATASAAAPPAQPLAKERVRNNFPDSRRWDIRCKVAVATEF